MENSKVVTSPTSTVISDTQRQTQTSLSSTPQEPPLATKLKIAQTLILSQHFERIEGKSRGVKGANVFRLDPGMDKNGNNCTYFFVPNDSEPWNTLADECPYFNNILQAYNENKHAIVCIRLVMNEEEDAQKVLLCELDTKNEVAINYKP